MIVDEPVRGSVPPPWFWALSGIERVRAFVDGTLRTPPVTRLLAAPPYRVVGVEVIVVAPVERTGGHDDDVEGRHSAWLYETLSPHIEEMVVTDATESREQKSDALDAFRLADKLRTGTLEKTIFKAPRRLANSSRVSLKRPPT